MKGCERIQIHSQRAQTQSRAARQPVNLSERLALSVKEFAAALGKSPSFIYRKIYAGRIKPIPDTGRLLVSKREIEAYLGRAEIYNPKPRKRKAGKAVEEGQADALAKESVRRADGRFCPKNARYS